MKEIKLIIDRKRTSFSTHNIIKIQASTNYSIVYFCDGKILISAKTLKKYESLLTPQFIRCSRNTLVNKKYIKILNKEITLTTGEKLLFSRRKFEKFKN
jgi:DNA-binding LytR/AlgR family response regulator